MKAFTFYTQESDCATHQERTVATSSEAMWIQHGVASALCRNSGRRTGFDREGFNNWFQALDVAKRLTH